jgi:hypothetical protein
VKRRERSSLSFRLLQAALLPDAQAEVAWRSLQSDLDLTDRRIGAADVLAILSERLPAWGIEEPRLALFVGARRRNWVACSLALEEVAARVAGWTPVPVLFGRAATVVAYLDAPGLLGLERPRLVADTQGPTLEVTVGGAPVRVPSPEVHLAWALRHRQWLDAAFAQRHPAMDWDAFVALFHARGKPPSLSIGLATLATLVGPEVPQSAMDALRPTAWWLFVGRVGGLGGQLLFRVRRRLPERLRRGDSGPIR